MTTRTEAPTTSRARIIETNEAAFSYWQWFATQPDAWTGPYLAARGLPDLDHGCAPLAWTRMSAALSKRGFTDTELLDAGLAHRARNDVLIDTFRNRLVLPIRDQAGAIIGFTARRNPGTDAHPDPRVPKYLNTTATPAFDKSRTWYGLDHDAAALLATGTASMVIVEGAMDAEAIRTLHGPFVPLAACGTAVTTGHIEAIAAINPAALRHAVIALDPDQAGLAAAHRLWEALPPDAAAEIRAAVLPADPAQLIQDGQAPQLGSLLDDAPRYVDALVDTHLETLPPTYGEQHLTLRRLAATVARLDAATLGELSDRLTRGYQTRPTAYLGLPDVVGAFIEAHESHRQARQGRSVVGRAASERGFGPPSVPVARVHRARPALHRSAVER